MTRIRIRKAGRLSTLAAGPLVAATLLAPLAAAAPAPAPNPGNIDDEFIAALHNDGIEHESRSAAIAAGHLVCHQLDMGKTQEQVATDVMNSSGIDGEHAGYFVAIAERAYCPQYADIPS